MQAMVQKLETQIDSTERAVGDKLSKVLDQDRDGVITTEEFKQVLKQTLKRPIRYATPHRDDVKRHDHRHLVSTNGVVFPLFGSDAEAAGIAAQLDLDGDGKVRPSRTHLVDGPFHALPYIICDHVMLLVGSLFLVGCQVSVRALVEYAEAKKGKADVEVRHTAYSSCGQLAPYSNATPLSHVRPAACVFFSWSLVRCWKTCSRSKASSTAPTHTRPPPLQLLPPLLPHPQRRRQPSIDQHEARGGALRAVLSWCHCLAPS